LSSDRATAPPVRDRGVLAIGQAIDGDREVLWIWGQTTEGAKVWPAVLNDLHRSGVYDVLIAGVDGPTVFPEAIEPVLHEAFHASTSRTGPSCARPTRSSASTQKSAGARR
jgi:hypothetical protein